MTLAEGTMAANWRVGIRTADGTFDFDRAKQDISTARAEAVEVAKRAKPGDVVFITNAAPYARTVEQRSKPVRMTEAELPRAFGALVRKVARGR